MTPAQATPLSTAHSVLLKSLIQSAYSVITLHPLQSGSARDVGGFIRLTRGGRWYDFDHSGQNDAENEEWEVLYNIEEGQGRLFKHA